MCRGYILEVCDLEGLLQRPVDDRVGSPLRNIQLQDPGLGVRLSAPRERLAQAGEDRLAARLSQDRLLDAAPTGYGGSRCQLRS